MTVSTAPPGVAVTTTMPRDPRLALRDHTTNLRDTLRDAADFHHKRHISRHFKGFAAAKYGYTKRSEKYLKFKRIRRPGAPDLVFTGATEIAVTTTRKITATSKQSRLSMRLPFKGGTGRFRTTGNMLSSEQANILRIRTEIEAISADEQTAINREIQDGYTARANRPGTKYRVRNRKAKSLGE